MTSERAARKGSILRFERILGLLAVISIVAAWGIGLRFENSGVESHLRDAWPIADHFEKTTSGFYAVYADSKSRQLLGYVGVGSASGYGGPMTVAVGVDLQGNVQGIAVITERETPAWFRKVADSGLIRSLLGKSYQEPFRLGQDVDGVTGATYTSRAIAESVMKGARTIAVNPLGLPLPAESSPRVVFGIPEITLLVLFAIGFFGHQAKFKYTMQFRWAAMLVGLVVLGFIYNLPLTLSHINQFLMGFWPPWQTSLYWYLLIGGILFVFTADNRNPYCQWFCPFGAAQECIGVIGRARSYWSTRYRSLFTWLRRGLVWFAIILALLFRNPGLTSYEIFGTLFSLLGSRLQFILLGMVLVAALFIKRPWCTYLCPIAPIDEFIRMVRKWILEQWRIFQKKQKQEQAI
jgi:uncharacterized protein with FMN-binding domain